MKSINCLKTEHAPAAHGTPHHVLENQVRPEVSTYLTFCYYSCCAHPKPKNFIVP